MIVWSSGQPDGTPGKARPARCPSQFGDNWGEIGRLVREGIQGCPLDRPISLVGGTNREKNLIPTRLALG